jgi:hypothetical protein
MAMDKREESMCVCIGCLESIDKANAIETKPWHWYHTQCVKPIKKPNQNNIGGDKLQTNINSEPNLNTEKAKVYVFSLTQLLIKVAGLSGKAYSS